jgi:disulfide bond formation protein DsbB
MPGFEVATNFFLVLTLVADALVAGAMLLGLACLVSSRARRVWIAIATAIGVQAVLVAWIVALVTTAGSLYYSEHLGFIPCELCWYQRIAMYPLVVVLGVGWFRRDRNVWITVLPFVVIGAPLSLYHWLVERVPAFAESSSCSLVAPCSAPYFEKLGFITLAWMCMSSFLLIGVLMALVVSARGRASTAPTVA